MKKIFVCIAYKYNDAFYSLSADEFRLAEYKILIDFAECKKNIVSLFDESIPLRYSRGWFDIVYNVFKLKSYFNKYRKHDIYVSSSNFHLLISRLIVCVVLPSSLLVMIEDGLMSYLYNTVTVPYGKMSKVPKYILYLIGISEKQIMDRVYRSYYLCPELAKNSTSKQRLFVNNVYGVYLDKYVNLIEGKKVFVGQPIYKQNNIGIGLAKYQEIISGLYSLGVIDIYLDHHDEDSDLDLGLVPRINIKQSGYTLEMIVLYVSELHIITFYSSLAYTLYLINDKVCVKCIKHKNIVLDKNIYETLLLLNKEIKFLDIF